MHAERDGYKWRQAERKRQKIRETREQHALTDYFQKLHIFAETNRDLFSSSLWDVWVDKLTSC